MDVSREARQPRSGPSDESAVKAITGVITAAAGAYNPILGMAIGAAKEYVDAPILRLIENERARRSERALQALEAGVEEANRSLDRLVHSIETSPELLALMSETVKAAMETPLQEKITALGRCLGRGVRDEATVDAERLRVRGLAGIEAPEVKLLEVLAGETRTMPEGGVQDRWPGWRRPEILQELPGFSGALDASIARLTAEGIIRDDGLGRIPHDDGFVEMWVVTEFGTDCLSLLRAVSSGPSGDVESPLRGQSVSDG